MLATYTLNAGREHDTYTAIAQIDNATHDVAADSDVTARSNTGSVHTGSPTWIDSTPTPEEWLSLPHVADSLPYAAFLIAIVELCERFAYYGLSGPFQNYISNKYNGNTGIPGALGLKQSGATAMTNLFQFWCYITPLLGAYISDEYLGKYATIKWFSVIYMAGIIVLFTTSLPGSIERGAALPGLLVAMIVIGLGTGGIKSNVSPLIAEQVRSNKPFVKQLSSGRKVVIDPELTIQRIYMLFYMCINFGSISAIATTMLELHVGFWSAFLLPLIMFCIGFAVLVVGKERYVIKPPEGGVIANAFRALSIAVRHGGNLDCARPSYRSESGDSTHMVWDNHFIDELETALLGCKVFLFFPIYWYV
ncbi:ATP-dependent DNA helicase chl1 [Coniothyrium glycines]